jgi:hypothetical protein
MDLMTPQHAGWSEFVDRLTEAMAGPDALEGDNDSVVRAAMKGCNGHGGTSPFESARAVLANMEMDVAASLEFFETHGGHCDCEILLNVEASAEQEEEG